MTALIQNIHENSQCKAKQIVESGRSLKARDVAEFAVTNDEPENLAMSSLYDENDGDAEESFDGEDDSLSSSSSYRSLEELDEDLDASYHGKKSVSWSPVVVTQTNYRLKTSVEDKELLHYTSADMTRFRQLYKLQIKAAKKLKLEQQREEEDRKRKENLNATTYQNPISSFVNMFMSMSLDISPEPSCYSKNCQHDTSKSRRTLETTLLIDTLYLF